MQGSRKIPKIGDILLGPTGGHFYIEIIKTAEGEFFYYFRPWLWPEISPARSNAGQLEVFQQDSWHDEKAYLVENSMSEVLKKETIKTIFRER